MAKLFYHHVGLSGSSDFQKTVFKSLDLSVLENITDSEFRRRVIADIKSLFPQGKFNCWGVPAGAKQVIRSLAQDDYVLLARNVGWDGWIPALCRVKLYLPIQQPALSEALWGQNLFPYIFFFDTEEIGLPWGDFLDHLTYGERYNPRGQFLSVADTKLEKFGGVMGYVEYIRKNYSASFIPLSAEQIELEESAIDEPKEEKAENIAGKQEINAELEKMQKMLRDEGSDPALEQISEINKRLVKAREKAFSVAIKRIYNSKCAVCGLGAKGPKGELEVESAHIYPKSLNGSDIVRNGVCLCRRHHWAFDVGWFVIAEDYSIIVSDHLPRDSDYDFIRCWNGENIFLHSDENFRPHVKFLRARRKLMGY